MCILSQYYICYFFPTYIYLTPVTTVTTVTTVITVSTVNIVNFISVNWLLVKQLCESFSFSFSYSKKIWQTENQDYKADKVNQKIEFYFGPNNWYIIPASGWDSVFFMEKDCTEKSILSSLWVACEVQRSEKQLCRVVQ